jgi:type VI protein secretion system component VasF
MADEKMGTNYAREIAAMFRETATGCKYAGVAKKLTDIAAELDVMAPKLYFKTQKGTEDMERIAAELEGFQQKLAACDEGGAESFCTPVFGKLEQILNQVKTMKVRMT